MGFHIIHDEDVGDTTKDNSNYALITIKQETTTARQVKGELHAQILHGVGSRKM
jgi:hypothetical protein